MAIEGFTDVTGVGASTVCCVVSFVRAVEGMEGTGGAASWSEVRCSEERDFERRRDPISSDPDKDRSSGIRLARAVSRIFIRGI
jgi:hypothetical protein